MGVTFGYLAMKQITDVGGNRKEYHVFRVWGGFCCKYDEQKGAGSLNFGTAVEGNKNKFGS